MAKGPVELCALCEQRPASKQSEHVWPRWYLGDQDKLGPGPFAWTHKGQPIENRDGVQIPAGAVRKRVKLPACVDCNQALGDRFEQPTKEILRALFAADGALVLVAGDAGLVGEWFAKTLLLLTHPRARYEHPAIDAKAIRLEAEEMPPAPYYDWLTSSAPPPDGLSVWLHRSDPADLGERLHRVPLPRVTADGTTTDFLQLAVAMHGLCFTVVVHPGWRIEHPLEATGEAVRVLPSPLPGDIDLTPLPALGIRTIAWRRCNVTLKPGVLGSAELPPLRASEELFGLLPEVWPRFASHWSG